MSKYQARGLAAFPFGRCLRLFHPAFASLRVTDRQKTVDTIRMRRA